MADIDMHEVRFEWPHTEPKIVIVTGTFDKWSRKWQLTKTATGFVGSTHIPWNKKILYKYIVDGNWSLVDGRPVEVERGTAFVNHVYIAPPKPQVVLPEPDVADTVVGIIAKAPENVDKIVDTTPVAGAASPVKEESTAGSSIPIAAEVTSPVDDTHTKPVFEPFHVDVGEASIADAKSDTTAVADQELSHSALAVKGPEAKLNKPSPLPTTPTKGEAFPSVSPPSSPSRFSSLRGSGKKKRTPSFFAKLKEVFKSDKEKDHSGKEKAGTKN